MRPSGSAKSHCCRRSTCYDGVDGAGGADEVVFLEPADGGARVAQRGAPTELASAPGPFRDFVEASAASSRWHLARG